MSDAGDGRGAPNSIPPSDNNAAVPPGAMSVARLLELAPGPRATGDVAAAWTLVRDIHAKDGADVLALALAIGCLCRALTPPADEAAPDGEGRP